MRTQFFVYYLLLDVVICRCGWLDEGYSKATAANHMEGSQLRLDSILASCLHRQKSMAPVYSMHHHQIKNCYMKYFGSCMIKTQKYPIANATNKYKLCGMIYMSREQNIANEWITIRVFSTEYVAINVISFDLAWGGKHCRAHGMIIRFFTKEDIMKTHRFCGRRIPWKILYERNKVAIKMYGSSAMRLTSRIYLYYWSQLTPSLIPFKVGYCEISAAVTTALQMVLRDISHRVVMYANVLAKIKVTLCFKSSEVDSATDLLNVHDGPGSKSPLIFSGFRIMGCELPMISTGSILTLIYNQGDGSIFVMLKHEPTDIKENLVDKNAKIFSFSDPYLNKQTLISFWGSDGSGFMSKNSRDTSTSRHIFTINQVIFTGPSNLDSEGSTECQYGGLFIYKQVNQTYFPEMEICEDHVESVVPVIMSEGYTWVIATSWYAGYTRGLMSGLVQSTRCTQTILQPSITRSFEIELEPAVTCALLYTSVQNSTITIHIKRTTGEILGPLDFEILNGLLVNNINPVLFSSITCVESDNITKHVREGVVTETQTLYPFHHSVTLSYCAVHITPLVFASVHFFSLKINRNVCTKWVGVYAQNIYLDPINGYCDTIYKNVKFPMFHVISSRDEAYTVTVKITNLCHRYSTIKVLDTRRDMSHVYTMYYGKHKQRFLLTRAQIKIEPTTMTNIECGERVVADLHNISSESKTEMFIKKWTTKLLKFQSSRLVQQLLSVIF